MYLHKIKSFLEKNNFFFPYQTYFQTQQAINCLKLYKLVSQFVVVGV